MDSCIWKENEWENANEESVRSCDRDEERVDTKKEKGVSVVKTREGRDAWVHSRTIEKYIRPSKLPQTALVFIVEKKDGKKWIVQDYRYLNEWTIKNNYSLPLISDIVENISMKKVFY